MGMDAYVRCNCWEQGKCSPPPVPVVANGSFMNPVHRDDLSDEENDELAELVIDWQETACEHLMMDYAHEHIGTWSGYHHFCYGLERVGWNFFPSLHQELPQHNGGETYPENARKCVAELDVFERLIHLTTSTMLIDSENGETIHSYLTGFEEAYSWSNDKTLIFGFDPEGFFIRQADTQQALFRATRVEQREHPSGVEYVNVDTEERFIAPSKAMQNVRLLHVETRPSSIDDFKYQFEALKRVFQASVETGNPVNWC
jgi:hypothetical protein